MTTIKLKRSTTTGHTPTLVTGEIAINETDRKMFYRDGSGNVCAIWLPDNASTLTYPSGAKVRFATGSELTPGSSGGTSLGTATLRWGMLYINASDNGIDLSNGTTLYRMASDGRLKITSQSGSMEVACDISMTAGYRIYTGTNLSVDLSGNYSRMRGPSAAGTAAELWAGYSSDSHAFALAPNGSHFAVFNTAFGNRGFEVGIGAVGADAYIQMPMIGTTTEAANVWMNSAVNNDIKRSTSSLRFKTNVTAVPQARIDALNSLAPIEFNSLASADDPSKRSVGFAAEEVAAIDPTLVHWGYDESDYEEVETKDMGNGLKMKERRVKAGATLKPDGVQYDRVLLLQVAALKNRVAALEAKQI